MRIGPLTQTDFTTISGLLEGAGHSFEVYIDEAIKADPRKAVPASYETYPYPSYKGSVAYITLEVSVEGLMLIKNELEKMGVRTVERDYEVAEIPGEFDRWVAERDKKSGRLTKFIYLGLILAAGAVALALMLRRF
jgi:hypothetical protein